MSARGSKLTGAAPQYAHSTFFYYNGLRLAAVRHGDWKLHLPAPAAASASAEKQKKSGPAAALQLYNLQTDPGESQNVAAAHPTVVAELQALVAAMKDDLGLDGPAPGSRPVGRVENPRPLIEFDR